MNSTKRFGFTVIELIVVIAIIGILVAILYPALAGARIRAKKVNELNLISHVGKAWSMYSMGHQDKLLPGYLSADVQAYREEAWAFPDESLIPPAPTYDSSMQNDAGPWTWRLLDYLDYDWRSLLFYRDTEWTSNELREHADVIATQPAFGYNGFYLGGWWSMDIHEDRPAVTFGSVELTDGRRDNVVATQISQIKKADNQIVFCSTFYAQQGLYHELSDDTPGAHFANPSILARVQKWLPLLGGEIEARFETYAPLGRFNGIPTVCFADGSSNTIELETLVDQQLWIPKAQPVGEFPASEFSHTVN